MALEMKRACESCDQQLEPASTAYICSYECTFCAVCRARLGVCPNCQGELMLRPRRISPIAPVTDLAMVPFQPRRTRMLSIHECRGWKLKVYEICFGHHSIPTNHVEQILAFVDVNIPWPVASESDPRTGFVIVHRGIDALWLLVHLWRADILTQFAFQSPLTEPIDLNPLRAEGFCGCVWELDVIKHERDAWVRCEMGSDDRLIEQYRNDNLFIDTEQS
jgi:uncharacterized protein